MVIRLQPTQIIHFIVLKQMLYNFLTNNFFSTNLVFFILRVLGISYVKCQSFYFWLTVIGWWSFQP